MALTRLEIQEAIVAIPDMPGIVRSSLMLLVNLISDREIRVMGEAVGQAVAAVKADDMPALRSILKAWGVPADLIEPVSQTQMQT